MKIRGRLRIVMARLLTLTRRRYRIHISLHLKILPALVGGIFWFGGLHTLAWRLHSAGATTSMWRVGRVGKRLLEKTPYTVKHRVLGGTRKFEHNDELRIALRTDVLISSSLLSGYCSTQNMGFPPCGVVFGWVKGYNFPAKVRKRAACEANTAGFSPEKVPLHALQAGVFRGKGWNAGRTA